MTITKSDIAEYDLVMLRSAVDGWPAGTRGHVVARFPMNLWVEVVDEQGEEFDLVWAAPEELQLVERWRRPEQDADQLSGLRRPARTHPSVGSV